MIQFNLLPDVKLEYIKAQKVKQLVATIAIIASAVALTIFILLFVAVDVVQKKNLSDLNKDIKSKSSALQNTPNLSKLLTIQNQLSALTGLHAAKPEASRIYDYISQVTPSVTTVSNISVDFTAHTISLTGNSANLDGINTFVDTLKFTTYKAGDDVETKAFSSVVLTGFGRATGSASYNITLTYDPVIFDITKQVSLSVPNKVSTRSITEQPTTLFKQSGGEQ